MPVLFNSQTSLTGYNTCSTTAWWGQPFTPTLGYRSYSVHQYVFRSGTLGGDIVCAIRAANGSHQPTGPNLCEAHLTNADIPTSSGWVEFIMSSPVALTPGQEYCTIIYRTGTGGTLYYWGGTTDANRCYSNNAGVTWSTQASFSDSQLVYGDYYCTTQDASSITSYTATLNGTIAEADSTIDERGFDYGLAPGSYTMEVTESGTFGNGAFSLPVTGLSPAVCYWYRAKFHHPVYGWMYGASGVAMQAAHDDTLVLFDEVADTPTAWNYMSGNSWYAQTFTPSYGYVLRSYKFQGYASTTGVVTVSVRATSGGKPTGADLVSGTLACYVIPGSQAWNEVSFGAGITLTGGTQYAFVIRSTTQIYYGGHTNTYGGGARCTSYDAGVSWSAPIAADDNFRSYGDSGVETWPPSNIAAVTAVGAGFLNLGGGDIDQLGFEWGEVEDGPYPNEVTYVVDADTGPFGLVMSPLVALTTYYYRAKAHDTVYGWLYGAEVSFTTLPPIPQVVTKPPTDVTYSPPVISAVGDITSPGSTTPDERGFVWGMTSIPGLMGNYAPEDTGYDGYTNEEGSFDIGEYTLDVKNLNAGKVYYLRAYAHNSYGYGYGSQIKVIVSDTVNVLYPTSDYSRGVRFSTAPGDWYPTGNPGNGITHYDIVQDRDASLTSPWGYWGLLSGNFIMEKNAYNDNYYTDLFGLVNPIRRTEGIVKLKWKSHLLRNTYPYGKFKREVVTHSTQYTGSEYDIIPASGVDVCEIFYNNHFTGSGWTLAEADAYIAGVSIGKEGSFGIACCDSIEVMCIWRNALARTDPTTLFDGEVARLNGYVVEDEGEECEVWFEWGETDSYGNETTHQVKSRDSSFYADLSGLDPDILYHYRAVILTACGETFYGDDMTMDYDYGAIILEQAYSVVGERQSIFTEEPVWTDITQYLMALNIKRGRLHELDKVQASTAVFTLNNAAGHFWRYNTAGDYYPDIKPLTLTRLRYRYQGVFYKIWYGVSETYKPGWVADNEGGATPIIAMGCVDLFKCFNRYKLIGANPAMTASAASGQKDIEVASVVGLIVGQSIKVYDDDNEEVNEIAAIDTETLTVTMTTNLAHTYQTSKDGKLKKFPSVLSGTRINDCLLELGWPLALSSVDTGQCYVIEHTPQATGTNIMEHLYDVAESEGGLIFMAGNGWFMFQDSLARTKAAPVPPYPATNAFTVAQATFNDDDTDSKYAHPELVDDDTFIYNEADIAGTGITEQIVMDAELQLTQGPRALTRTSSQLADSDDAFNQAFVFVEKFKDSLLRCDSLLVKPQVAPTNLLPIVLGFEISTRLTFNLNTATNPAMISRDYHVEGVEHNWNASTNFWTTKWQLWNVAKVYACKATHDGYIGQFGATEDSYETVHDEPQGDAIRLFNDDVTPLKVGQHDFIGFFQTYGIERAVIEFDTSPIDPSWTISKALLAIRLSPQEAVYNKQAFDLTVVKATLVTSMPITVDTYGDLLPMLVSLGEVTIPAAYFEPYIAFIELNATGIAYINKGGLTRLALRSSRDMSMTSPADDKDEWVLVDSMTGGFKPRLFIVLE